MPSQYSPPLAQQKFLLSRVHGLENILQLADSEADMEACWSILDAAGRFSSERLAPLNPVGDQVGCQFDEGNVITPPGFKEAYRSFVEQGWSSLSAPLEDGGQGLPLLLQLAVSEMMVAGCAAFAMLPLQQRAAAKVLSTHARSVAARRLIRPIVSGRCGATIAMTEANAGSDAGRGRTRAIARADGLFELHGSKIFISYGDHDFTDQIVHLVLAREAYGLPGGRGMSLFVVRKWLDDACTVRNPVHVASIERKMGLKASPTCVLALDGAVGERLGEPNKGLATIFTMVNVMRLEVSIQGIALGHAAYVKARAYAENRLQGDGVDGMGPVQLIDHPDVRRNLMLIRARIEGMRALIFEVARQLDIAQYGHAEVRNEARMLAEFLLPVCKAAGSEAGFEATNTALQVFGGHGYIVDSGMEQYVRDIRIATIFEGTTGIQAIDLLTRKLVDANGERWRVFVETLRRDVSSFSGRVRTKDAEVFTEALVTLDDAAREMRSRLTSDRELALAGATPFLQMVAVVALGWTWLRLAAAGYDEANADAKLGNVSHFFFENVLPSYWFYSQQALEGASNLTAVTA